MAKQEGKEFFSNWTYIINLIHVTGLVQCVGRGFTSQWESFSQILKYKGQQDPHKRNFPEEQDIISFSL